MEKGLFESLWALGKGAHLPASVPAFRKRNQAEDLCHSAYHPNVRPPDEDLIIEEVNKREINLKKS